MKMTKEQIDTRNRVIADIVEQLIVNPFTFEFKVVKKPQGIKIIHEVTQEEMDAMVAKNKVKATPNT